MKNESPKIVVIIAAGMGSRLKSDKGVPKPLLLLHGRPLILRVLDRFYEAGIKHAVIVTGYRSQEVQDGIKSYKHPVKISFIKNDQYKKSNGLSVLAAKKAVGSQNFFLSMADHIFDAALIDILAKAAIPKDGLVLAVDRKLESIYDEDDATKVLTKNDFIVEINKELKEFDAVDTGLFACTPALFDKIEKAASQNKNGESSLSDGVKALSAIKKAVVCDIKEGRWQDVDTPGAVTHAEKQFTNLN